MSKIIETVHQYPVRILKGDGAKVLADDKKWYIDFWGDEACSSLGNGSGPLTEAINAHMQECGLVHVPKMFGEPIRERLASVVVERAGMDKITFANSGTEANEAMFKMARKYWWRKGQGDRYAIATLEGNFHGRTGLSMAASDSAESPYHKLGYGPMPVGFHVWRDFEDLYRLAKIPGGLAAVSMSTMLGNNLIKTYPQDFFDQLVEFRDNTGTLIVLDEIQVGTGRTGKFMCYQNYGFRPDIVTIGKGFAGGFPLTACMATEEVASAFQPGDHFNTFGGNVLACRVSLAVVEFLDKNMEKCYQLGEAAKREIQSWNWIDRVDGMGLHLAFRPLFEKLPYDGTQFCAKAMEFGLLICTHRKHGPIRFTAPLVVSSQEMDDALEALRRTHNALVNV